MCYDRSHTTPWISSPPIPVRSSNPIEAPQSNPTMLKALDFLLLSLLLLLPFSATVVAQTFDEPMRINTDHENGVEQGGPILRVGNDGKIYIAWVDFRDNSGGDLYLRVSDNGGETFGPERVIY